jgi:hypothetical protein
MAISDNSNDANTPAVLGENSAEGGAGVFGRANAKGAGGVIGHADNGRGVYGESPNGTGVWGFSNTLNGVVGESNQNEGVRGISHSAGHGGVVGINDDQSDTAGQGVYGESIKGEGVRGVSHSAVHGGVVGTNDNSQGIGIYGIGGKHAGFFEGDVNVTKTLTVGVDIVLANGDCAEDFDIAGLEKVEPGTVMVIDSEGALKECDQAYDKRVAGVISGAGNFKPGIVLDKQESSNHRMPIALLGKVYCKVDASYGAIEVGDLLTTSPTLGHGMKATDQTKAFGAVIGKALCPLSEGQELIPILIALQ